jgi:hypothetical protein
LPTLWEDAVQTLDPKLREWKPESADDGRARLGEIIEMADSDVLDVSRSRIVEQAVLDLIDHEPVSR